MKLSAFDRRVLEALWQQREIAEVPGVAQRIVQALGLRMDEDNVARVLVSMHRITTAGTQLLDVARRPS